MHKQDSAFYKDGYAMRPARAEDAEEYYAQNYAPLDLAFTREAVVPFFLHCAEAEAHRLFLLIASDGTIAGESVLSEIDREMRSANFRIGILSPKTRGKGIGSWMIHEPGDFAFRELKLRRPYLDVFSFNPRAEHAYLKAGFKREGVLRDAIRGGESYAESSGG